MQALKSYRAYYDNGSFIPYEPVTIPKGSQAVVTVLDFPAEGVQELNDGHGSYICAFGHVHDYSKYDFSAFDNDKELVGPFKTFEDFKASLADDDDEV